MKLIKFIAVIFLFSACNNNNTDTTASITDTTETEIVDSTFTPLKDPGTAYEVVNTKGFYVWEVDVEKKTLKKNPEISTSINADSVINGLNQQYTDILLDKVNINKETINLKIANSDYLTNQIGSTGAAQYIAQAVINLTSVPGIKYVHIDFAVGSHASPGTWSKKDFPGYIVID